MNYIKNGLSFTLKKTQIIKTGKTVSLFALMLMTAVMGLTLSIPNADAALIGGAVGPVIPAGIGKGFPAWYMDQNGLALEVMEAADGFGISDPVDPNNPFSQELGFNAEGFYWVTEGAPVNPHGVSLMVLALEMAFAGEAAVDGEQSVFGRIRFRFDVGEPGTYTIRHPFGTNTYVVDAVGPGPEINDSSDIGCFATLGVLSCDPNNPPGNPNNFGIALQSGIGPFLTWDTFNIDPALSDLALTNPDPAFAGKRYVGNPAVAHAIKGSPVGQNFIRVEGPNIGGIGIDFIEETEFAVGGRIAVIDTIAPTINVATTTIPLGSVNVPVSVNITDNIGVRSATIDLGPLGNTLTALINNANEVPPTGSTATGSGAFTIDTAANTLSFNINATGLSSPVSHVHIHRGAVGTNGDMLFDAGNALPAIGVWNYPEIEENNILTGNTYVQIHTLLFDNPLNLAGGEIRGQIKPQSNVVNMQLVILPNTNGIWSVLIPNANRLGTFNLPIVATDGSQVANAILPLIVNTLASVGVAPASATIIGTSTQQLTASPLDNNGNAFNGATITWSSSNPAITVNPINGTTTTVTGVLSQTPETAIITATAVSGATTVTGTSSITVTPGLPVLTSVTVTPNPAVITIAPPQIATGSIQLLAAVKDQFGAAFSGATTTWSSDNTAVATVNPTTGLVTSVATGTAIITASATDGIVTVIGTTNVNVVTGPVLTTINVTPATSTVQVGGTVQLSAATLDQNGAAIAATLAWTSNNPAVATVNATSGLVTAVATGTATISASSGTVTGNATIIVVPDATAPVITIIGANPASITVGSVYTDAGATAVDNIDGNVTANITSTSTVNANVIGTYAVTYTVSDTAGNVASSTRTVNVTAVPTPPAAVIIIGGGGGGGFFGGGAGGFSFVPLPTSTATPTPQIVQIPPIGQVLGEVRFRFDSNRGRGERGDDVRELQIRLRSEGVFSVEPTGFFGPLTEAAIRAFQQRNGLAVTGRLDIETRGRLNSSGPGSGQVQGVSTARPTLAQLIALRDQLVAQLQRLINQLNALRNR